MTLSMNTSTSIPWHKLPKTLTSTSSLRGVSSEKTHILSAKTTSRSLVSTTRSSKSSISSRSVRFVSPINAPSSRSIHSRSLPIASAFLSTSRNILLSTRPPAFPFGLGQPTHETRPHYIATPGNLTPGISSMEYYERRLRLAKLLPPNSIAILVGAQTQFSSGSVFYDFQQNNDLYYLTGWLEPNSVAIISKDGDGGSDDSISLHMLVPAKNPRVELWEGEKLGLEGAYEFFNADHVEDIAKAEGYIRSLVSKYDNVFFDSSKANTSIFSSFFGSPTKHTAPGIESVLSKASVRRLAPLVAQLRAVKSELEINVMHAAGQISSRAINKAIAKVGSSLPLSTEKSLAKYLDYEFVHGGCDKLAYIPVVASGKNALTIHYVRNDDLLYRDELVFVDAGGKLGGYCADISRAWPNSPAGFSQPQKDLYQVVLNANKTCIDLCDETRGLSLQEVHDAAIASLAQDLRQLPGFSTITNAQVAYTLFPHYIGHHLGLDLHDIPSVSRHDKLVAGNVVTIEPGLYVPFDDKFPKHFQGIGVRVEDDIVVGKTSSEILNLTSGCVKEVADIEALIRAGTVSTPGAYDELVVLDI